MRVSIVDYEVVSPWGQSSRRYVCRPPGRLGRDGDVLVSEMSVESDGWAQLADSLLRIATAPGGRTLDILEVGPDFEGEGAFVVSETVPHQTLGDLPAGADQRSRLEAVEAAARAAHALHEVGLAHGSIHPGSILLTDAGPVLDLPRLDARLGEVIRVAQWRELVTLDPELLGGESPARGSDIWALGATLHSVLSDRPLFPGIETDEPVTAVQRMMFTRPEPDPSLSPPLLELITRCLAADSADRPGTALAVAERLHVEVGA